MRGIIITTHKSTELFYNDLIKSLEGCKYPITTVINTNDNNQFEKAGLLKGIELYDEFIYLHDTVIIKNQLLFDILFDSDKMFSISPKFLMYLGKYNSKDLKELNLPDVSNKRDAVNMEMWLGDVLCKRFPVITLDNNFIDGNHTFEDKHGRKNMVLENIYLKKYKSCYDVSMIDNYEKNAKLSNQL